MPSIAGGLTEEEKEELMSRHNDQSEAVQAAVRYYLYNKFGVDL